MPVFLSNVDDYLAPSQACVNPIFSEGVNGKAAKEEEKVQVEEGGVVPRKRTVRRKRRQPTPTTTATDASSAVPNVSDELKETIKASMADCLACSGCVTSAETVLVEQHSLQTLHEKLQAAASSTTVVVTISPASWSDVVRHLQISDDASSIALIRRKLATALQLSCRATVVLDAHVPLQWSWEEAAREFCHAYQRNSDQPIKTPLPSMAVSSTQSQDYGGTITTHVTRSESHLPLLSATCPALVCLVEKSHPSIVPHLSTTKSPMAMAGTYIKHSAGGNSSNNEILHIAIMPCHDKKLEASRKDFASVDEIPDVDLVLTSKEWIELIKSQAGGSADGGSADGGSDSSSNNLDTMRTYIESLIPAASISSLQQQHTSGNDKKVVLVESQATFDNCKDDMEVDDDDVKAENADFFAYGSGGYADFIFRYASQHLFGVKIQDAHLSWTPVAASGGTGPKVVSARVAASRKKDYHAVSLYKLQDGTYSMTAADGASTSVLRFATAYGFQTLQRILQPMESNNGALEFDYVEAMACPSGCVNGGGQVRVMERETPKETRQRVFETKRHFELSYSHDKPSCSNDDVYQEGSCGDTPFGPKAQVLLHTRYHVVPALQHTLGAAAGVAVQDTQW